MSVVAFLPLVPVVDVVSVSFGELRVHHLRVC
jgi:hypothetical protein